MQTLSETCEDLERKRQKVATELQTKDARISCLDGQFSHTKAQLDAELRKVKLQNYWIKCMFNVYNWTLTP